MNAVFGILTGTGVDLRGGMTTHTPMESVFGKGGMALVFVHEDETARVGQTFDASNCAHAARCSRHGFTEQFRGWVKKPLGVMAVLPDAWALPPPKRQL